MLVSSADSARHDLKFRASRAGDELEEVRQPDDVMIGKSQVAVDGEKQCQCERHGPVPFVAGLNPPVSLLDQPDGERNQDGKEQNGSTADETCHEELLQRLVILNRG